MLPRLARCRIPKQTDLGLFWYLFARPLPNLLKNMGSYCRDFGGNLPMFFEDIQVTYSLFGLGGIKRPIGPVSTVTVELKEHLFDFFFADDLFQGLTFQTIPALPFSITGENQRDSKIPNLKATVVRNKLDI